MDNRHGVNRETLPLNVYITDPSEYGIDIYVPNHALHVAVVTRTQLRKLDDDIWKEPPGVYILLDHPNPETGVWGVYVGKAPSGLKKRVRSHIKGKDHWYRAVLVKNDTTHGYTSADVGWLEGRLYDLMNEAEDTFLHNGNRPVDETLPLYTRQALEGAVVPISRILTLLGHDPSPPRKVVQKTSRRISETFPSFNSDGGSVSSVGELLRGREVSQSSVRVSVVEVLNANVGLSAGAVLVHMNSKYPAKAVLNGDGTITITHIGAGGVPLPKREENVFPTPSAAACYVIGGRAANGWREWGVETPEGLVRLSVFRKRLLDLG